MTSVPSPDGAEPSGIDQAVMERLAAGGHLLVASDFDGVLAPIVDDPLRSAPISSSIDALARLVGDPTTSVAIVSGREKSRLAQLVPGADRFTLVGSHGAELDDAETDAASRERLRSLVAELEALTDRHRGLFVEVKALSVAAHFRRVDPASRADAAAAVDRLRPGWPGRVVTGKEVVEFTTGSTDKGDAVTALRHRMGATTVVYLGDDVTDEDAFAALTDGDVGVKIGPGRTAATHRIDSPADVATFLTDLADRRCGR